MMAIQARSYDTDKVTFESKHNQWSDCKIEVSTGTWYHVALTYASGTVTLYLDGSQVDSESVSLNLVDSKLSIGGLVTDVNDLVTDGALDWPLECSLDEVRAYNSTLTAEQVLQIYNYEKP